MKSSKLIYNVVALKGEPDRLEAVYNHYIANHAMKDGNLFNLRDMTSDWLSTHDTLVFIEEGNQFKELCETALDLNNEIAPNLLIDIRQSVINRVLTLERKLHESKVNLPQDWLTMFNHIVLSSDYKYKPESGWITKEQMEELFNTLRKYHPSTTGLVILDEEIEPEAVNMEEHLLYKSEEDYYMINYGFKPLSPKDFIDYQDEVEDTQSYILDDKGLIFSCWSKYGDIKELIQVLCKTYDVEASIISGNKAKSYEYKIGDSTSGYAIYMAPKAVSLERTVEFLDAIGQLENTSEWFGWMDQDIHPEMDNDTFIATMPTGGID